MIESNAKEFEGWAAVSGLNCAGRFEVPTSSCHLDFSDTNENEVSSEISLPAPVAGKDNLSWDDEDEMK